MNDTLTAGADQAIRALVQRHREPQWLAEMRNAAWAASSQAPLPDRADHLWRYSDPAQFVFEHAAVADAAERAEMPEHVAKALESNELAGAAVVRGGGASVIQLTDEARRAGVVLLDLHAAATDPEQAERVRQHLGALVGADFGKIEAANTALWAGGMFLYVPRKAELRNPIHISFAADGGAYQAPRVLAVVEEQAVVTLVEEHLGGQDDPGLSQSVSEIFVGQAARLHYVLAQRQAEGTIMHGTQRVALGRDASCKTAVASFGGSKTKLDLGILLREPGARSHLVGLLFGRGRQRFDHHTVHAHTAPHTYSNLDFKVVLTGKARSAYTGLINIEHEAPFSEAYQENRNLVLSDDARAESIPELEISIDEVQCTHGATVGPVDENELFYLMSRGIPRLEALRQIVAGFLEPILQQVPEELAAPLRDQLQHRLKELT